MSRSDPRSVKPVIGLAALAGALAIVYFAARPALTCSRLSDPGAACVVTAHALGLMQVAEDRVDGVEAAEMVSSATGRSRTPPRLMFVSSGTRHDLGYFSQLGTLVTAVRHQY